MDRSSSGTIYKSGAAKPLELFEPYNFFVWLSFYFPIILVICVVGMSFVFQNFKGFIYLGFLLGCCFLREIIYKWSGSIPSQSDGTICTSIQYSKYGNPSFSAFVFAFTMMYLSLPMFTNGSVNSWLISGLSVYGALDIYMKINKGCIIKTGDLTINLLLGLASSALIVTLMYSGGSGKYLFFNEVSSDKEICYQPKDQTFKCSLYQNGELISEMN